MINYDKLHSDNHSITELSNVLLYLFRERTMCDTEACCELFHRFTEKVKDHIDLVDQNLYSDLLIHEDHENQKLAKNFMSGSQEIKKIMAAYMKEWCPRQRASNQDHKEHAKPGSLDIKEYERFLHESEEMFNLVLERIQDETEKLYPQVRTINSLRKASSYA